MTADATSTEAGVDADPGPSRDDDGPLIVLPLALSPATRPTDAPSRAYVAVDGGATKTEAAIILPDGRCMFARTGPSNPEAYGHAEVIANLLGAISSVLDSPDVTSSGVALGAVFAGIAGVDTAAENAALETAISNVTGDVPVIVMNDVVTAWATALLGEPGVVAISGTGSNCFGVGVDGSTWRSGGWGHILDDTGSGYMAGLDAIRAIIRERDGRGPATSLRAAALRHFGVSSVVELSKALYFRPFSKADIAGFAPNVAHAALAGDPIAHRICESSADALTAVVRAVLSRIELPGPTYSLGLVGGFVRPGSLVSQLLTDRLPGAEFVDRDAPALTGSYLLACKLGAQWPADAVASTEALSVEYADWRAAQPT